MGRDDCSAGSAGGRLTRIRTADQHVCGWVHYHSTVARFDSSPHCLKPSLPLKKPKKPKLCVSVCLLVCLPD